MSLFPKTDAGRNKLHLCVASTRSRRRDKCCIYFRASRYFSCLCLRISIIVIIGDINWKLGFHKFSRTLIKLHSITWFGFVFTFRCSSFPGIGYCLTYVHHRTSRSKVSIKELVTGSEAHHKTSRNFDVWRVLCYTVLNRFSIWCMTVLLQHLSTFMETPIAIFTQSIFNLEYDRATAAYIFIYRNTYCN